jgi:hypothetical protein
MITRIGIMCMSEWNVGHRRGNSAYGCERLEEAALAEKPGAIRRSECG